MGLGRCFDSRTVGLIGIKGCWVSGGGGDGGGGHSWFVRLLRSLEEHSGLVLCELLLPVLVTILKGGLGTMD